MKLNIEQEIINLKALIDERAEEDAKKYQLRLMRKHLNHSRQVVPLNVKEATLYG